MPYPGSPQAVNDLLAGRVTMFFSPASTVPGQIEAGKLRALAKASDRRAGVLPDVQTMAEAGMPDFNTPLPAPVGTPQGAIEQIASAANKAMHAPASIEAFNK